MKPIVVTLLLSFVVSICFSQSADIEKIKQLNETWIGAYPKKDTIALAGILADDFIMINGAGNKLYKKDILRNAASTEGNLKSTKVEQAEVRVMGDMAIITAKATFISVKEGNEVVGQTSYLDVYEKRKGRWVAVAAHVTVLK